MSDNTEKVVLQAEIIAYFDWKDPPKDQAEIEFRATIQKKVDLVTDKLGVLARLLVGELMEAYANPVLEETKCETSKH